MISKSKHQKHTKLLRPQSGNYARQEIGFLGATCGRIERLVQDIMNALDADVIKAYIDADHGAGDGVVGPIKVMDMISHHEIHANRRLNQYDLKINLGSVDFAFINSNHFDAEIQIPIVCLSKRDSLKRKLGRLTNVKAIILDDGLEEPFDFLIDSIEDKNVPIFSINEVGVLADFIGSLIDIPKINGLVLAGGKSTRMGEDKSLIEYNGLPQQVFMANELQSLTESTYISKRSQSSDPLNYPVIEDSFQGLGPFGAILSAFRADPNAAWLVVACDQPLLNTTHLSKLIEERDRSKIATCYYNPETDFPEPLITIWEPKAYPRLLEFLSLGYSCPRKVLINSDIKMIKVDDTTFMKNVNTPQERAAINPQS